VAMSKRRVTRMVVVQEVLRSAASSGSSGPLYGIVREQEGLIQVLSTDRSAGLRLVGTTVPRGTGRNRVEIPIGNGTVTVELEEGLTPPEFIETVALHEELESRRLDVRTVDFRRKHVTLFGAGSIGSVIAQLLAEAGVGSIRVVDNDTLDASNLSRHACDLNDLGRSKAMAVSDLVRRRAVASDASARDVLSMPRPALEEMVHLSDLVIATMDSQAAQFLVNEVCITTSRPGVFVQAYERARAGECVVVRPGLGPCLYCCVGFRASLSGDLTVAERRRAYQDADANRLDAEPGLGADIAFLVSVATVFALALLDPEGGRKVLLDDLSALTLIHGGSEPQGPFGPPLFERPFEVVRARVSRDEPCPVCGWSQGAVKRGVRG